MKEKIIKRGGREYFFQPCRDGAEDCTRCAFYDLGHRGCTQRPGGNPPPCINLGAGEFRRVVYRCPECDSTEIIDLLEFNINTRKPHRPDLHERDTFCNNCGSYITPKRCKR